MKANKGAAGVDGVSIEQFEQDLKGNLFKLWNRMSSGSYFPPPVRMVEIPKSDGNGVRVLGVPTVADRIAQTVVAMYLEPGVRYTLHRIDHYLMRWLLQKYKRFHGSQRRAWAGLHKAALDRPTLFAHWRIVHP